MKGTEVINASLDVLVDKSFNQWWDSPERRGSGIPDGDEFRDAAAVAWDAGKPRRPVAAVGADVLDDIWCDIRMALRSLENTIHTAKCEDEE
jgi:hypothetical protein